MSKAKPQAQRTRRDSPKADTPVKFREFISLESFDKTSCRVVFTEPESIEAIKRLGLTFADFNYKPKGSFKKPGCDTSVTELLYAKHEQRRQNLIDQALEMREKVFEEKKKGQTPKRESSVVIIERKNLENEQKSLEKLQKDRSSELKKLIIQLLRTAFARQAHTMAMEKSMQRIKEAERKRTETLQLAYERSMSLPAIPNTPKNDPPGFWVDRSIERVKEQRRKEAEERKKKALIHEEKMQLARAKSQELYEKQRKGMQDKLDNEDVRYQNWQKLYAEQLNERHRKAMDRAMKEESVVKTGCRIEEAMKRKWVEKLYREDERAKEASLQRSQELQDRLSQTKQRFMERTEKVREMQDSHLKRQDAMRRKIEENDQETEKRLKQMTADMNLKFAERQFDRDTKRLSIQHKRAADEYDVQQKAMPPGYEASMVRDLKSQSQKVVVQKAAEQKKYMSARAEIMRLFAQMSDDVSFRDLRVLQALTGMDEEELEQLVEAAKSPASPPRSRASTSMSDRSNLPRVTPVTAQSTPMPMKGRSVLRK